MKKLILFLLMVVGFAAEAQTIQVSGNQSGSWDADTVLVIGDVTVDESLQVMPGTLVLFNGFYGIEVGKNATFKALGTETDSIVFTVADTTGFSNFGSDHGGWNGFQLNLADQFILDYCVLEYGKSLDSLKCFGGAVSINDCEDVHIHHSTLHHNGAFKYGGAIFAIDSQVEMLACSLHHNFVRYAIDVYNYGGAASFLKCDVEMSEMDFHANDGSTCIGGALSLDSCSVVLDRSTFVDNIGVNGGGLYLMRSNDHECRLSNLLFDHNYTHHFGGGFALADVSPKVSNVLVVNNSSEGVSCNGVFFYGVCSPAMTNCIIYGNYAPNPELIVDTAQMWAWTYEGSGPSFYNCLVEGGLRFIHSPENLLAFENIIDADPMFVDAANHDFRLAKGSPCINAGDPFTPENVLNGLDLNGNPRVIDQRIDIGPYEYNDAAVSDHSVAPFAKLIGNPLHGQSRIEFDDAVKGEVELSVYAITGRCVAQEVYRLGGSKTLSIGDLTERLSAGVYLLEVKSGDKVCTLKAVK